MNSKPDFYRSLTGSNQRSRFDGGLDVENTFLPVVKKVSFVIDANTPAVFLTTFNGTYRIAHGLKARYECVGRYQKQTGALTRWSTLPQYNSSFLGTSDDIENVRILSIDDVNIIIFYNSPTFTTDLPVLFELYFFNFEIK